MGGKHLKQGLTIRLGAIDRARLEAAARDSEMTVAQWIARVANEETEDELLAGVLTLKSGDVVRWSLHRSKLVLEHNGWVCECMRLLGVREWELAKLEDDTAIYTVRM